MRWLHLILTLKKVTSSDCVHKRGIPLKIILKKRKEWVPLFEIPYLSLQSPQLFKYLIRWGFPKAFYFALKQISLLYCSHSPMHGLWRTNVTISKWSTCVLRPSWNIWYLFWVVFPLLCINHESLIFTNQFGA